MKLKIISLKKAVILGAILLVALSVITYNIMSSHTNITPNSATLVKRNYIGLVDYV